MCSRLEHCVLIKLYLYAAPLIIVRILDSSVVKCAASVFLISLT